MEPGDGHSPHWSETTPLAVALAASALRVALGLVRGEPFGAPLTVAALAVATLSLMVAADVASALGRPPREDPPEVVTTPYRRSGRARREGRHTS